MTTGRINQVAVVERDEFFLENSPNALGSDASAAAGSGAVAADARTGAGRAPWSSW